MQYTPLTRNGDFVRAYKRGKYYLHPSIVIYVNKNRFGYTRVGIVSSKKIGNAVKRNRSRRVIRHALYEILPENVGGLDLVFVARSQTAAMKSWQLQQVIKKLLQKARVPLPE